MNIVLITQNEPFYLGSNLQYFFKTLPKKYKVTGCVVSDPSPFGKKEPVLKKVIKTKQIFGTSFFVYYSIKYIKSKLFDSSLKNILKKNKIPEIKIKGSINSKSSVNQIKSFNPDLLVSILGNQIFKSQIINLAPKGCINLHTALLPKYRGLMPTFWVLKNNETHTGVSVFFVDEGIDSGPIIIQEKVEIGDSTQQDLIMKTKRIGMDLVIKAVELIDKNQVNLKANPESEKSYFSFPSRKDVVEFRNLGKRFF